MLVPLSSQWSPENPSDPMPRLYLEHNRLRYGCSTRGILVVSSVVFAGGKDLNPLICQRLLRVRGIGFDNSKAPRHLPGTFCILSFLAHQMYAFARAAELRKIGECLDGTWRAEREAWIASNQLPPHIDLQYAMARGAGAWGGRPYEDGLLLMTPPENLTAVVTTMGAERVDFFA